MRNQPKLDKASIARRKKKAAPDSLRLSDLSKELLASEVDARAGGTEKTNKNALVNECIAACLDLKGSARSAYRRLLKASMAGDLGSVVDALRLLDSKGLLNSENQQESREETDEIRDIRRKRESP